MIKENKSIKESIKEINIKIISCLNVFEAKKLKYKSFVIIINLMAIFLYLFSHFIRNEVNLLNENIMYSDTKPFIIIWCIVIVMNILYYLYFLHKNIGYLIRFLLFVILMTLCVVKFKTTSNISIFFICALVLIIFSIFSLKTKYIKSVFLKKMLDELFIYFIFIVYLLFLRVTYLFIFSTETTLLSGLPVLPIFVFLAKIFSIEHVYSEKAIYDCLAYLNEFKGYYLLIGNCLILKDKILTLFFAYFFISIFLIKKIAIKDYYFKVFQIALVIFIILNIVSDINILSQDFNVHYLLDIRLKGHYKIGEGEFSNILFHNLKSFQNFFFIVLILHANNDFFNHLKYQLSANLFNKIMILVLTLFLFIFFAFIPNETQYILLPISVFILVTYYLRGPDKLTIKPTIIAYIAMAIFMIYLLIYSYLNIHNYQNVTLYLMAIIYLYRYKIQVFIDKQVLKYKNENESENKNKDLLLNGILMKYKGILEDANLHTIKSNDKKYNKLIFIIKSDSQEKINILNKRVK